MRILGSAALLLTICSRLQSQTVAAPALVLVDVAVTDAAGVAIPGLAPADFEVLSDGQPARVTSATAGTQRLNIVVLIDASASTHAVFRGPVPPAVIEQGVIDQIRPGDRARVGSFAKRVFISGAFTADPRELKQALAIALDQRDEETDGPSPLWDAAYEAITMLTDLDGRRAVVLLTDGRGTANVHTADDVAALALRSGVLVNSVGEWREGSPEPAADPSSARADRDLRWIAESTGGLLVRDTRADRPDERQAARGPRGGTRATRQSLAEQLRKTVERIREMYSVAFEPPVADGKAHRLHVRVKRANATVGARPVYVAPLSER